MTRLGKQLEAARPIKSSQRQQLADGSTKRFPTMAAKSRSAPRRPGVKASKRLTCPPHVLERVTDLFSGNTEAAWDWLNWPAPHLYWKTPLEVAQTEQGAEEVINLIIRIGDGIPP